MSAPATQTSLHAVRTPAQLRLPPGAEPFYLPAGDELTIFEHCHARQLAVMLKGPTGCGKTRFVEHMAWRLKRPLVTISCHDDLSASDLVGRFLICNDGTAWSGAQRSGACARHGGVKQWS